MSLNKRRKFDTATKSPRLSAFAARKALQSVESSQGASKQQKEDAVTDISETIPFSNSENAIIEAQIRKSNRHSSQEPLLSELNIDNSQPLSQFDEDEPSSLESRAESPEIHVDIDKPPPAFSSLRPSKINVEELSNGALRVRLAPGERLVILGQYKLCVEKGQVTLMGATLQASETLYPIYALGSHSLPVIRCLATDVYEAEITLHQLQSGLETLAVLSPLFDNLGNQHLSPLVTPYSNMLQRSISSSFQILMNSTSIRQRIFVQPISSAPEWNAVLSKCSADLVEAKAPVIMICGPKSSGKSTFAKLLANKLLLAPVNAWNNTGKSSQKGVAFLDIDPGQPEYSVPGNLALLHVQEPNFGPPFTHPVAGNRNKILQSHSIGALSPSMDTKHYMACVKDLISHYQQQAAMRGCPLVINTPGWVLGTGLEILLDLVLNSKPTSIIYMSIQGPPEVVNSLKEVAKQTPVFTIPSQASEYTTRTSAQLRTMQCLSYFHLTPNGNDALIWSGQPLTSLRPWEIRYSGDNPGILGVMCYGEQPPPDLLADTINGSLVAVVVIDDMAAIPCWATRTQGGNDLSMNVQLGATTDDLEDLEEDSFQPWKIQMPLILPTPQEEIPYFNPANSITLNPRYCHSIGLALVRGIDMTRRRLQILTPIEGSIIKQVSEAGKHIVLVSGKLDTPGWAFTEELMSKTGVGKADDTMILVDDDGETQTSVNGAAAQGVFQSAKEDGYGFENAPWVERLEGSQGRGVGSRVWRVRRDLGRQGDGD